MLVILTDRDEHELGQEVMARVWRHRLVRPSAWEAVKGQFRVDRLDPALADARWLVDLLVDVAPPRGYPPPPSGFLDFGTAWRTFLRHGLRLDVETPTLEDLLRWGQTDTARSSLSGPAARHRDRIAELFEKDVGPAARHVLRIVAEGRGADLVPLGLIADVLWAEGSAGDQTYLTARVRFEGPVGAKKLSTEVARSWGDAATRLVRTLSDREDEIVVSGWLARAENLLTDIDAIDLAIASDVLPWAFTERLIRAGRILGRCPGCAVGGGGPRRAAERLHSGAAAPARVEGRREGPGGAASHGHAVGSADGVATASDRRGRPRDARRGLCERRSVGGPCARGTRSRRDRGLAGRCLCPSDRDGRRRSSEPGSRVRESARLLELGSTYQLCPAAADRARTRGGRGGGGPPGTDAAAGSGRSLVPGVDPALLGSSERGLERAGTGGPRAAAGRRCAAHRDGGQPRFAADGDAHRRRPGRRADGLREPLGAPRCVRRHDAAALPQEGPQDRPGPDRPRGPRRHPRPRHAGHRGRGERSG